MFSLVSVPQFQINGDMMTSDRSNEVPRKWPIENCDLIETTLKR